MKKNKKILIIGIVYVLLIIIASTTVFADSDLTNGVEISVGTRNQFEKAGNTVFGLVRTVGIICSVIGLMIIGIKYMLGSVEEKAEYKKTLPVYLLGVVLIFGILVFGEFIYNLVKDI